MLLQINHETRYDYSPVVETAQHILHLCPLQQAGQQVLSHQLQIEPSPSLLLHDRDGFGNSRSYCALDFPHHHLLVQAQSLVQTAPAAALPSSTLSWEQARERLHYRAGGHYDAASAFCFASDYVPRHPEFRDYATPSFSPGRPLLAAAQELMQRLYQDMRYQPLSTDTSTPALQALAQRRGVCQDFAHIMIACLRSLGLPARYVSGYLLSQPPPGQPRLVGADASHAWVALYLPAPEPGTNGQWIELDPTNGRSPGEDYVTLAFGRDYGDVSPLRGVIHGGAHHHLQVAVTVTPAAQDTLDFIKIDSNQSI